MAALVSPLTFSNTKNLGRASFTTLMNSNNTSPRFSLKDFLVPAVEKGWHGGPPITAVASPTFSLALLSMVYVLKSVMSPLKTGNVGRLVEIVLQTSGLM